jgi:hypothetical protein
MITTSPRLEERAAGITDPVERLKYLRRRAPILQRPVVPGRRFRWGRMNWLLLTVIILAIQSGWSSRSAKVQAGVQAPSHGPLAPASMVPLAGANSRVWQVEGTKNTEVYSNGLRVDLTFATHNRPRAHFPIFSVAGGETPVGYGDAPRGIVYHTTESHVEPFEEEASRRLQYLGRNLLEWVRTERAYHYLIDRFGRVYRVVEESDAANHSGTSVWGDAGGIYVNLNDSFLSIAFEGQTETTEEITVAQVTAARMLTEMLRWRYPMPAENFVTHAQVSVNPLNMRMSAHTDWARDFPFAALGLPDNYTVPPASIYAFGFSYDDTLLKLSGGPWKGLDLAEDQLASQAAQAGEAPARYKAMLQHRYKDIEAVLKEQALKEESLRKPGNGGM